MWLSMKRKFVACLAAAALCFSINFSTQVPVYADTLPLASATTDGAEATIHQITFSKGGGLYSSEFLLSLTSEISGGTIRYTLDGSDPTVDSAAYTAPVEIKNRTDEANELSAIVVENQGPGGLGGRRGNGAAPAQEQPPAPPAGDAQAPEPLAKPVAEPLAEPAANLAPQQPTPAENTPGDVTNNAPVGRGMNPGGFSGSNVAPTENVFKGTVVKAAIFSESGERLSEIAVQSYFVSADIATKFALPVVSIVTDKANFYDEETGIYSNYQESGADWERPVHFELYATDGTAGISQNMGVRIHGNSTRANAQKSMRFYAKASYDADTPDIEYELFDGLTDTNGDIMEDFKRILLRNSGNDNTSTLFRDALMQSLASDLNVDTQAAQPCVAFVNGEFWGIYNIRERYDNHYFADHYNIDKSKVAVLTLSMGSDTPELDEGDESDLAYYQEMWDFFNENDLSNPTNYKKALEYIDADNFIDYFIANIFSGNHDWPANNMIFWRYKTDNGGYDSNAEGSIRDGRFRWALKDMDFGFGMMVQASNNSLEHATSTTAGGFGGPRPQGEDAEGMNFPAPPEGFELPEGMEFPADGQLPDFDKMFGGERPEGGGGMGFTSANSTMMFRKLLENEDFQAQFINRFCDLMNTTYDKANVAKQVEVFRSAMSAAMVEHIKRYPGSIASLDEWNTNIDKLNQFAEERPGYMQGFLQEMFGLSDVTGVTIETDAAKGYVRINDTDITAATNGVQNSASWRGEYFADTTQRFTAVPAAGHTFEKFVVTSHKTGESKEYTQASIAVDIPAGGITVQAIFS